MRPYLDIINHFGYRAQMKKLNEEVFELIEAIDTYEDAVMEQVNPEPYYTIAEMDIFREHVVEEVGDVLLLITQFLARYEISKPEIDKWMDTKLERTIERIRTRYYGSESKPNRSGEKRTPTGKHRFEETHYENAKFHVTTTKNY